MTGIIIVVAIVGVLYLVLRTTDALFDPFAAAFGQWADRALERLSARYGSRVELAVPLQVVGGLFAGLFLILMASGTTSVAVFLFYFMMLAVGGFVFELGRRIARPDSSQPGALPVAGAAGETAADAARGHAPSAAAAAVDAPATAPRTYTTAPPSSEEVRRRLRISELRAAATLTAGQRAELDALIAEGE
jgi:hypothetical protein